MGLGPDSTLKTFFGKSARDIKRDFLSECSNVIVDIVCLNKKEVQRLVDRMCDDRPIAPAVRVSSTFDDSKLNLPAMKLHRYISEEVTEILARLDIVFDDGKAVYNAIHNLKRSGEVVILKVTDNLVRKYVSRFTKHAWICTYKSCEMTEDRSYVLFASPRDKILSADFPHHTYRSFVEKNPSTTSMMKSMFGNVNGSLVVSDIIDRDDKRIITLICHSPDQVYVEVQKLIQNHSDTPIILRDDIQVEAEHFKSTNCVIRITDTFENLDKIGSNLASYRVHVTELVQERIRVLQDMFDDKTSVYNSLRRLNHCPYGSIVVLKSDNLSLSAEVHKILPSIKIFSGNTQFSEHHASCVVILGLNVEFTGRHNDVQTFVGILPKTNEDSVPGPTMEESAFLSIIKDVFYDGSSVLNAIRNMKPSGDVVILKTNDKAVRMAMERFVTDFPVMQYRRFELGQNKSYVLFTFPDEKLWAFHFPYHTYRFFVEKDPQTASIVKSLFGDTVGPMIMSDIVDRDDRRLINIVCHDREKIIYKEMKRIVRDHPDHPLITSDSSVRSEHFIADTKCVIRITDTLEPVENIAQVRSVTHVAEHVKTFVDQSILVLKPESARQDPPFITKAEYVTEVINEDIWCNITHADGDSSRINATIGDTNKDDLIRTSLIVGKKYDTEHDQKKHPGAVDMHVAFAPTVRGGPSQWFVWIGENFYTDRMQLIRVFEEIKVCRIVLQNYQSLCKHVGPDDLYDVDFHDFPNIRTFRIIHKKGVICGCLKLIDLDRFRSFIRDEVDSKFKSWLTVIRKVDDMLHIEFADMHERVVPVSCFLNSNF